MRHVRWSVTAPWRLSIRRTASAFPSIIAALIGIASLLALISWRFNFAAGLLYIPGSTSVAPETAAAFLLAAFNLHGLVKPRPRITFQILSGLLFLLGGIFLGLLCPAHWPVMAESFIFGLFGLHAAGPFPRIAAATAIGFAIWGAGLLAMQSKDRTRAGPFAAALSGTVLISLAISALLNLFLRNWAASHSIGSGSTLSMASEAALLFCLLGSGLCYLAVQRRRQAEKPNRFNLATLAGFLIVLSLMMLLVGVNVTMSLSLGDSARSTAKIAHARRSLSTVREILAALREAESKQRAFLLIGDQEYLHRFQTALERLQTAQSVPPEGFDWIPAISLDQVVAKRLADLQNSTKLKQAGHADLAIADFRSGRGLLLMERVEDQAQSNSLFFEQIIAEENACYTRSVRLIQKTILTSYFLAIAIVVCAGYLFWREIQRRAAVEDQLRRNEADLEDRMQQRTAELQHSEMRYRSMLDQSPLAIHILDRDGNSLGVNTAFEKYFGVTGEALRGYNIWADPQPAKQGTVPLLERAFGGEAVSSGAIQHVPNLSSGTALHSAGAKMAWVEVVAYPVKDGLGRVEEVVLLCQDVTDREAALKSVRDSEVNFRELTNVMPQIVWTASPDGVLDYYNQRWYDFTGFSPGQLQAWEPIVHPDDLEKNIETWSLHLRTQEPYEYEQRLWDRQRGEYRWHLARAVPVLNDAGKIDRWIGCTTNIHENKAAEEVLEQKVISRTAELQKSNKLLQAKEEDLRKSLAERDTLFREVHHRVKNNLQVISSLLRMHGDSLKNQPAAAAALDESRRRVLSMAMIHERLYGNGNIHSIDFGDYARSLVRELLYSFSLPGREVTADVQAATVHLTVEQAIPCGLILNEILTNALKYAFVGRDSGKVSIVLECQHSAIVVLTVSDDGVGLPPGFNWRKAKSMGMPIIDILTQQLEGTVEVDSGNGVTITVRFPQQGLLEQAA